MGSNPPLLLIVVILAIALAVLGITLYQLFEVIDEYVTLDPHLIINHEDTVAFAQLNNGFSSLLSNPSGPQLCAPDLKNYWAGLLFHLGDYDEDCSDLQGVRITTNDGEVHDFEYDQFHWINIVSRYEDNRMEDCGDSFWDCYQPMQKDEVIKLFPTTNRATSGTLCWDVGGCTLAGPLHSKMTSVSNIITYWQGADGYQMNADYEAFPNRSHNRYGIRFRDEFEVRMYTIRKLDGSCSVDSVAFFTDVKEIEVLAGGGGTGNGVRVDPPIP